MLTNTDALCVFNFVCLGFCHAYSQDGNKTTSEDKRVELYEKLFQQ